MSDAVSRRSVITGMAATASAVVLKRLHAKAPATSAMQAATEPTAAVGSGTSAASARSVFEAPARTPVGVVTGASLCPLHHLTGTITPNDLVFERHHSGIPTIDPRRYRLMLHGLVDRPLVFTLEDLRRLPSVSRVYFLECAGNGRSAYRDPKPDMTPQHVDGMTSNGEWTGVPLAVLLHQAGVRRTANWLLAEGGDAAKLSRSIPLDKALDDAMVAYAFNGEPLRPAHGYPARLFLPGYEANTCVKWLRRLEAIPEPNMSKDETSKYTDPLPNGTARMFSFVMDAKSIITHPAHPARIERGWHEIAGIAWSGRGRIAHVDVSVDGGREWLRATLQDPALPKAHTRFHLMWRWNGAAATIMSRATDETGYVQPTRAAFIEGRGRGTDYHFNHIRAWHVARDGHVTFAVGP